MGSLVVAQQRSRWLGLTCTSAALLALEVVETVERRARPHGLGGPRRPVVRAQEERAGVARDEELRPEIRDERRVEVSLRRKAHGRPPAGRVAEERRAV